MAIDFTGVTNVFMGGNSVYSADTSLQAICQGETEQWAYSDQGYVWRVMGSTIDGYERFYVGDVVCIGGALNWSNLKTTNTYHCLIGQNYLTRSGDNYIIDVTELSNVLSWSDEFGTDGVKIGWHLPDKTSELNMVNHSYVVKQTANNGVYARFSQGYGSLGTGTSNRCGMYPLTSTTEQWWCTYNNAGNNQEQWCYGRIYNDKTTKTYLYVADYMAHSTASKQSYVVFKRVKINANNQ